jgi:hypothetical protein
MRRAPRTPGPLCIIRRPARPAWIPPSSTDSDDTLGSTPKRVGSPPSRYDSDSPGGLTQRAGRAANNVMMSERNQLLMARMGLKTRMKRGCRGSCAPEGGFLFSEFHRQLRHQLIGGLSIVIKFSTPYYFDCWLLISIVGYNFFATYLTIVGC